MEGTLQQLIAKNSFSSLSEFKAFSAGRAAPDRVLFSRVLNGWRSETKSASESFINRSEFHSDSLKRHHEASLF